MGGENFPEREKINSVFAAAAVAIVVVVVVVVVVAVVVKSN